jgi:hypothetical protein
VGGAADGRRRRLVFLSTKTQAPNPKQIPSSKQPNLKLPVFVLNLDGLFGACFSQANVRALVAKLLLTPI